MRVLYVNPIEYGANPGIDMLGHGLAHRLDRAGVELRILYADFREPDHAERTAAAVEAGLEAGVDGIVLYTLDPDHPAEQVARARAAGIGVFTLTRPRFPVDASLVYPNFNHGLFMAEHLATIVEPAARVCVIGGPDTSDDVEEVVGILHGCSLHGLRVLNDPHAPRYKNVTDAAEGGYEAGLHVLADFAELEALVPYNDETMMGVLRALDETGRHGEMRLISRNGTPHGVQAVKDGRTDGTWDLDPPGMGLAIGELVVRQLVDGERLGGELAMSPIGRMITRENAHTWVPWGERVPMAPFRVGL
jgi:ABC-type sugar transport system substrate-binding protein